MPANALDKKIKYESDDTSIATVDDNGKVTAVGEGTTEIILTCGDGRAVCEVTVKGNGGPNSHLLKKVAMRCG